MGGRDRRNEIAVSTDGGQTWAEAEFLDPVQRHAWRRWKFDWLTPKKPGQYTLLARAKDANGSVQPDEHDQNYGTYVINHLFQSRYLLPLETVIKLPVDEPDAFVSTCEGICLRRATVATFGS